MVTKEETLRILNDLIIEIKNMSQEEFEKRDRIKGRKANEELSEDSRLVH